MDDLLIGREPERDALAALAAAAGAGNGSIVLLAGARARAARPGVGSNYRSNGEIAHGREYLLVVGERR